MRQVQEFTKHDCGICGTPVIGLGVAHFGVPGAAAAAAAAGSGGSDGGHGMGGGASGSSTTTLLLELATPSLRIRLVVLLPY